ncbi:snapalysin [Streptomyces sp. 1222.5]|uniref:snapalysin n=1 Tax=unclassified Streptomyces TaxID=2593676 RepID=UPI00089A9D2F|nr:snapalysin [Streptomyces sp. 5112.2]SED14179.1 snapalysin [Streptomyces sp. 1222.5]
MKSSRTSARLLALALGLASSALGAAVPAAAQTADTASAVTGTSVARYSGSVEEAANNKAFFEAVLKSVTEKRAAQPNAQAVTVYYDASQAPSFRSQIASAASIWNSSESNVKLQEASSGGADFSYREGNDPRGSYSSSNNHGSGYVFLDYTQNQQYDSVRVVTHETGHVLGLPDDYGGPCSELMSGGTAGPSCTNRYPNATERSRVDQLWANGLAQDPGKARSPETAGPHAGGVAGGGEAPNRGDAQAPSAPAITAVAPAPVLIRIG